MTNSGGQDARKPSAFPWSGPPLVALGAALWATDALFRSAVVARYTPLFIVFFNHWLCLLPALPVLYRERRILFAMRAKDWLALGVVAVCGSVVGMLLFTQAFATAGNYTVPILMQKLQPLFAISLARIFLKERVSRGFALWAALALGGAYLVSFGASNAFSAMSPKDLAPAGEAVAAAAVWGATTVAGRALLNRGGFLFVTAARFTFGSLAVFLVCLVSGELAPFGQALQHDLGPFAGMAFVSGLLPLAIYYLGLRSTPAAVATLCELAFPVTAILVNWVLLNSPLNPAQLAGAALLLVAVTALSRQPPTSPSLSATPRGPTVSPRAP